MNRNKCNGCDGTGKHPDFLKEYGDDCSLCKGTGIDSKNTQEIICPYCGEDQSDSWEAANNDDDYQCGSCEKHFQYESETVRHFSSWQVECLNDQSKHKWKEQWIPGNGNRQNGKVYSSCNGCNKRKWIPLEQYENQLKVES